MVSIRVVVRQAETVVRKLWKASPISEAACSPNLMSNVSQHDPNKS